MINSLYNKRIPQVMAPTIDCALPPPPWLLLLQNGNTALHMAARFGHQAAVDVLAAELDMPAAALAANDEGKTPLMLACSLPAGGEAVLQFLLGLGADPAAVDAVSWIAVLML
jgi:hypothetical protein